jgi:ArsR family transcriptional regulator, arsenate/arsenite/antimonite-responsive transcriptional repressor
LTDTSTFIYTLIQIDLTTTLPVITCCAPLAGPSISNDEADATATLFRALADPARVKIVNLLARSDEAVCVCELVPAVELSQPTVSHHLKKLTEAGLLEREERGKWAFYSVSGEAVERLAALVDFKEVVG